jgi:hypothetical protein
MPLWGKRAAQSNEESVASGEEEEGVLAPEPDPKTDAPKYVTADEMQAMLDRTVQAMQQQFQRSAQTIQPQHAQEPDFGAEVSDEQIEEAFQEGDVKKAVRLQRQQRERDKKIHQYEMQRLRNDGAQAIGEIGETILTSQLSDYQKYRAEIDTVLESFPVNVRRDANVRRAVYDMVRGRHIDDIINERLEQASRQRKTKEPEPGKSGRSQNAPGQQAEVPYFTETDLLVLRDIGKSPDEFARARGYKDMKDYERVAREQDARPVHKW